MRLLILLLFPLLSFAQDTARSSIMIYDSVRNIVIGLPRPSSYISSYVTIHCIEPTAKKQFRLFEPETRRQGFWAKQALIVGASMYAGFTRHERDVLRDYYVGYQKVWPNANPQWSNPQLSAMNKYVDGDRNKGRKKIGTTGINVPVFCTDKWHMNTFKMRVCYSATLATSLTLWKGRPNWKQIGGQTLLVFVADVIGNGISSLLYGF